MTIANRVRQSAALALLLLGLGVSSHAQAQHAQHGFLEHGLYPYLLGLASAGIGFGAGAAIAHEPCPEPDTFADDASDEWGDEWAWKNVCWQYTSAVVGGMYGALITTTISIELYGVLTGHNRNLGTWLLPPLGAALGTVLGVMLGLPAGLVGMAIGVVVLPPLLATTLWYAAHPSPPTPKPTNPHREPAQCTD
ncbi:MAG: hypothetical protein OEZ06_29215 [Myxococcales bacterium]|nr:hypothetical protein [Myxococcales bacterium]